MKKILGIIIALSLVLCLAACGNESGTTVVEKKSPAVETIQQQSDAKEEPPTYKPLTLERVYSVPDYLDFSLIKIQTTKRIEATMSDGLYYENSNSGETYIDVVLDIINTGTTAIDSEKALTAIAENATGAEFPCTLYAVESNNNTIVSAYERISPLSTARLHCAISVPENEVALTIKLTVNNEAFSCDYTLGQTLAKMLPLVVDQVVEIEDYAKMTFLGVDYTEDLLPSNPTGFYTHYAVDSADSVYCVAKFDITNYQSTAKQCDTFVGVKAVYMGKYTYTGFSVLEDEDGRGFSSYENISPLSTRHLYTLIQVPKVVIDKSAELHVIFNGEEYVISYGG